MSKRNLAQTEIPVGNEIGRKHDPDEEFARVFGEPAAARERLAYVEARRCTCGSEHPDKWGARWKHKPPCPRSREEVLMRPDDNGDTRSEARYEWNDTDTEREHREDHRWSIGTEREDT